MTRRLEFTAQTKRDAFTRSGGICECHRIPWLNRPDGCGIKLVTGAIFYEHILCSEIRPDNSLENCACLCKTCWREKTDSYDRPVVAKSNHARDRSRGIRRMPKGSPLPGTIASGWRKRMNGTVERR